MMAMNAEPRKLVITQITINESTGLAMARIPGPSHNGACVQPAALVLQAVFIISKSKIEPGFQFWHHIPSSTLLDPFFVHVSITGEREEGEEEQLAEIKWPPQDEYRETFAVAIAHMLTYSNQIIQSFYLS